MRPRIPFSGSVLLASLALSSVGCGSLDGHTGTPGTLATVTGQITNPQSMALGSPARVAVVWLNMGGAYSVAEDLPFQPTFPSSFTIELQNPPPQAAMIDPGKGGQFKVAIGFVVAYEDLNGNGKLDLVTDANGAFIDKIVGTSPDLAVFYLEGSIPPGVTDSNGNAPPLGYSLFRQDPPPSLCADAGSGSAGAWLPMSTAYDLEISSDPEVNQIMCANYGQGAHSEGSGGASWNVAQQGKPPSGYAAPGTPGLQCACDGSNYTVQTCKVVHTGLCEEVTSCTETQAVVLGGATKPAGWPCP
jgi:hypothetical protein